MLMNRLMPGGPDAYDGHNHNHNHDRDHNERSRSPDGRAPQAAASAGAFPAIHPGIGSTSSSSIDIDSIGSAAHGNNGGFAVPLASVAQAGQAGQAGHAGHAGHGSNPWAAAASSSLVLPSPSSSLFERSIAALASTFRGSLDADDLMLLDMAPFDGDASDALAAASDAGSAATAAGSAAGSAAGGLALDARSYAHTHPHAYAHAAYGTGMFTQQPLYASQQRSLPIGHHLSNHHQHHHQQQHQHPLAASFTPSHPADFLSASGSGSPAASSDGHDDSAAASASRPQSDRTKQQPPLQQSPLPDPAHRRGGPESASPDLPLKTAARPPLISVSAPGTARSQPARPPPIRTLPCCCRFMLRVFVCSC
ncbi:hypothetical protein BC831DRAFT_260504 [Entophlyctis helioformis]|nr:hypothetical protein BC831DRAFT_260504 [Entophlyctis helioformis]